MTQEDSIQDSIPLIPGMVRLTSGKMMEVSMVIPVSSIKAITELGDGPGVPAVDRGKCMVTSSIGSFMTDMTISEVINAIRACLSL